MSEDHFRTRIVLVGALIDEGSAPIPVGMGVLLSDALVLTCAHVIADATGHNCFDKEPPRRGVVIWPAIERLGVQKLATGTVAPSGWFPKLASRSSGRPTDIALLHIVQGQLMPGVVPPLSLSVAVSPTGSVGRLLGLVSSSEGADLMPMQGLVGEAKGDGYFAFHRDSGSGYWIEPGCSGAPVRSVADSSLLGLVVQQEVDTTKGVAFLISSAEIRVAMDIAGVAEQPENEAGRLALVHMWSDSAFGGSSVEADRVKRFVDLYAGKASKPSPFVGRDCEIASIVEAVDRKRAVCFIGGRAGMGKSALMVHAAAEILRERPRVKLILLPISLRFGTADQVSGLAVLAAQLQALFPVLRTVAGRADDPGTYRNVIAAGWQEIKRHYLDRFVLLVDAIDEAIDRWIEEAVLPSEMPANLVLLVSGRTTTVDFQVPEWVHSLCQSEGIFGWNIEMTPLPLQAVSEAIGALGYSFQGRPDSEGLLRELYRLSDFGDPLLVSLWVAALFDMPRRREVSASSLRHMQPGIRGYLDEWFRQQKVVWKAEGHVLTRQVVEPLLKTLAAAEGAVKPAELYSFLGSQTAVNKWTEDAIHSIMSSSWRILADTGDSAFTFVHPRIRYHYVDELERAGQLDRIRVDFVLWGRSEISRLSGDENSLDLATYVIENHVTHLHAAAAALGRNRLMDAIHEILRSSLWPRKWLQHHGTYGRYVADLQKLDSLLAQVDDPQSQAARVWCRLCHCSISSIGESTPPAVIDALVASGAWSAVRAHSYVRSAFSGQRRFHGLADLLPYAGTSARRALVNDLLSDAPSVLEPRARAVALARLLEYEFERRDLVVKDAVACALSVTDARSSVAAISLVTRYLETPERLRMLGVALSAAASLEDELQRATAMSEIAEACRAGELPLRAIAVELERLESPAAFDRLLQSLSAKRVLSPELSDDLLVILLRHSDVRFAAERILLLLNSGSATPQFVDRAVAFASSLVDSRVKTAYEVGLCQRLPWLRDLWLPRISQILESCQPDAWTAQMFVRLSTCSQTGDSWRVRALEILHICSRDHNIDAVAIELLNSTQGEDQIVEECVSLLPRFTDVKNFQTFVSRLAALLLVRAGLDKLLSTVRSLVELPRVPRALAAVARSAPLELDLLVDEAIGRATSLDQLPTQCVVLCAMADGLLEAQRVRILRCAVQSASGIGDREGRMRALGMVAVACNDLPEVALDIFDCAKTIDDHAQAAGALIRLSTGRSVSLRTSDIRRLLQFIPSVRNERERAARLREISEQLLETDEHFLLALEATTEIRENGCRCEVLLQLASQLGKFPACADRFLEQLRLQPHITQTAKIYEQIYLHLGNQDRLMRLALESLERVEPHVRAICLASLEGVRSICDAALRSEYAFSVENTADAIELLACECADPGSLYKRLIDEFKSYYYNTEEQLLVLEAVAWRLSDQPSTVDLANECWMFVRRESGQRMSHYKKDGSRWEWIGATIRPFLNQSFRSIAVGSLVLRLTHPTFAVQSPTGGASDVPSVHRPHPQLLALVSSEQTRAGAFRALESGAFVPDPSRRTDEALDDCALAVESVCRWWP